MASEFSSVTHAADRGRIVVVTRIRGVFRGSGVILSRLLAMIWLGYKKGPPRVDGTAPRSRPAQETEIMWPSPQDHLNMPLDIAMLRDGEVQAALFGRGGKP